jgi:hypothetical protein
MIQFIDGRRSQQGKSPVKKSDAEDLLKLTPLFVPFPSSFHCASTQTPSAHWSHLQQNCMKTLAQKDGRWYVWFLYKHRYEKNNGKSRKACWDVIASCPSLFREKSFHSCYSSPIFHFQTHRFFFLYLTITHSLISKTLKRRMKENAVNITTLRVA